MLVLFETAAGYALFKVLDEHKLQQPDNIWKEFETPDKANRVLELQAFKKFKDTADALQAASSVLEGKIGKTLKKFLKKCVIGSLQDQLAVADAKLGNAIKDKLNIACLSNNSIHELMRGIRTQMDSLITDLKKKEMAAMALGLAHSLSRYKLKFNPEKIDTMIIQAVSLLDDLDKELNNYIMRCREWYGWHFPELGKIVQDHTAFAKAVNLIGMRENTAMTDLSSVLPDDMEQQVKEAAQISMGTEISDLDVLNIRALCDQIIEITEYRTQLYDYLKNRMMALAPNVTALLGELVAARLIAHAGSLMNLAKYPASTVQILGAEKALFRALKTKKDTPKYGLIYHAQLIGQAPTKIKGKMSRMLAAKAALACRVDAFGEDHSAELGIEHRARLEQRINTLQHAGVKRISGMGKTKARQERHKPKDDVPTYDTAMDSTIGQKRRIDEVEEEEDGEQEPEDVKPTVPTKRIKTEIPDDEDADAAELPPEDGDVPAKKKKKKRKTKEIKEEPVEFVDPESFGPEIGDEAPLPAEEDIKDEEEELEPEPEPEPELEQEDGEVQSEEVVKKKKKKRKSRGEDVE